jgi:hypothetical protein
MNAAECSAFADQPLFQALHARVADSPPCTIAQYSDVASGVAAQHTSGAHPFVVHFSASHFAISGQPHWEDSGGAVDTLLSQYGERLEHYSQQGTVRARWADAAHHHLVGIHLDAADRAAWRSVFGGTAGAAGGWDDAGSQLGVILGRRAHGVANDFHQPVFFYHLHGRKVWSFGRTPVGAWSDPQPPLRSAQGGVCAPELLATQPQTCVLGARDFLYAPGIAAPTAQTFGRCRGCCHLLSVRRG